MVQKSIRRCISNKEHYELTMGSLFDGIGGFPLAAVRHGIRPVWASEIEAFPIEVTKLRFPDMIHVGDITKLFGGTTAPTILFDQESLPRNYTSCVRTGKAITGTA